MALSELLKVRLVPACRIHEILSHPRVRLQPLQKSSLLFPGDFKYRHVGLNGGWASWVDGVDSRRQPPPTRICPFSFAGRLLITGGAVSLDGRFAVLRTYADAFEFD